MKFALSPLGGSRPDPLSLGGLLTGPLLTGNETGLSIASLAPEVFDELDEYLNKERLVGNAKTTPVIEVFLKCRMTAPLKLTGARIVHGYPMARSTLHKPGGSIVIRFAEACDFDLW